MRAFQRELTTDKAPGAALAELVSGLTVPLARHGYNLRSQTQAALVFERTYRPWWAWIVTLLTFPLGIVFYLISGEAAAISVTLEPAENGMLVRVAGEGPRKVQSAFETMTL